jgi:hypothetical protein
MTTTDVLSVEEENVIYLLEKEIVLKNIIVSDEDPYNKIISSMKDEMWYFDTFDD